ncbi:MAG TPA: alpha/beta hydrolase [Dehalococcoidia bacterium]|nr:alpha/beta hydrolase [Dehalococcoidia bacterium]
MPKAEVNGISMYYESHGPPDRPAIVFAHGAGGNHLSWWQQVPYFSKSYRCITIDHRGFGSSLDVSNGPGQASFAEDLRALLDTLGIDRAVLVAQSMGGRTCMGFAAAYPQRVLGLVMCDTIGAMNDASLEEARARANAGRPRATLDTGAYNPKLRQERPGMAFLYDQIRATNPPRSPDQPAPEEKFVATTEKLAKFTMPALFIAGSDDALVAPQVIKHASTLIPGARYVEVPGCGHSVYFEDAPAFNRILEEFLSLAGGTPAK